MIHYAFSRPGYDIAQKTFRQSYSQHVFLSDIFETECGDLKCDCLNGDNGFRGMSAWKWVRYEGKSKKLLSQG